MSRKLLTVFTIAAMSLSATALGCREEGAAERLGKTVDDATSDMADAAQEAADAAQEAANDAGRAIKRGADDARDAAHDAVDDALD